MSFFSFLRLLGVRRPRATRPARTQTSRRRTAALSFDHLEERVVPAGTPPTILSVTPPDGTATASTLPTLKVQFSEAMTQTDVQNPANYLLVNSEGATVPIQSVTVTTTSFANDTATLNYNSGNPLTTDHYTLFVHGDQLHDGNADGLPVSGPGTLIVANSGQNNVSTVNLAGDGTLGAIGQFDLPRTGAPAPNPVDVILADLNGDGVPDLAVLDSTTNQLSIFLGQSGVAGAGFAATADLVLNLPAGANPTNQSLLVADLNNDNLPDLVVADPGTNQVSVFLNQSAFVGDLQFASRADYSVGAAVTPVSVTAADLNGDGYLDLTTANSVAATDLNGDGINDYSVSVLMNKGAGTTAGTFSTGVQFRVGDVGSAGPPAVAAVGVTAPTGIASGDLNGDTKPDLVVSGSNAKLGYLLNTTLTNATTPSFVPVQYLATPGTTTSVAIASIAGGLNKDIAATTNAGGGEILVYVNAGGAASFTTVTLNAGVANPTGITVAALDGTGKNDLLYTNAAAAGSVSVLLNTTTGATVGFAAPVAYGVDSGPQALALADSNGDGRSDMLVTANQTGHDVSLLYATEPTGAELAQSINGATNTTPIVISSNSVPNDGSEVVIRGVLGNTAANGTWQIKQIDSTDFSLVGSVGNGSYGGGGTWVSPDNLFRVANNVALNGTTPDAVAVGDLNGDSLPDYVVAQKGTNSVSVILSTGQLDATGRPLYASPFTVATGSAPVSVAVGDLNGDGVPDIVVANQQGNTVTVLINSGNGTSYTSSTINVGRSPTRVVLGDFNRDGYLDLAVAHEGGTGTNEGVTVVLNNHTANTTTPFAGQGATEFASGTPASAVAVGDLNHDGNLDLVVASDSAPGNVVVLNGDGTGNFSSGGTFATGVIHPDSIAVADMNLDGYADVVVASASTGAATGGVAVLLNQFGTGLASPLVTAVAPGTGLTSLAVTNVNQAVAGASQNPFPDVIVSTLASATAKANVFALMSNGNGTFHAPVPYLTGATITPASSSYLAVTPSPLIRLTTFLTGGNIVSTDLVSNGNFEDSDLSGEQSNLLGWQTFDLASNPGSAGRWLAQSGTTSPLSLTTVPPPPQGNSQAMLDEPNLQPYAAGSLNLNAASSYSGSHALYQDITIPADVTSATLSFDLYIDDSGANGFFSDPNANTNLNWQGSTPVQVVRVDILSNPNDSTQNAFNTGNANFLTTAAPLVTNVWESSPAPASATSQRYFQVVVTGFDLSAYKGLTIRLRFASANNQGRLILGVDNVHVNAVFADATPPAFTSLALRNPGYLSPTDNLQHTTDPTIVGRITAVAGPNNVADNVSGLNNVAYIAIDVNNDGDFNGPDDYKITNWDAQGNFTFTTPNLTSGQHTVGVEVVDKTNLNDLGGNVGTSIVDSKGNVLGVSKLTFVLQGDSVSQWAAQGPDAINVTNQGVDFSTVSGRVTSVAADPTDLSGNTYYVGSANGGVWKTTDGGASWAPLMDYLTDGAGNAMPAPIGAIAVAVDRSNPTSPQVTLYAATGVADTAADSRAGVGVFESTDGGLTWTLAGDSGISLLGARISKLVVANDGSGRVSAIYAAVAGGITPGVYELAAGSTTWVNVLTPTAMGLPVGTALASVTDLAIDPFNSNRLLAGLGNIGLLPANSTAGLWVSTDGTGASWSQPLGGYNPPGFTIPNSTLPGGASNGGINIGRVTLAMSTQEVGSEPVVYILMGTPPGNNTPPNVNFGTFAGLYKTSNGFLDFTKVMLKQDISGGATHNFQNINLLGQDASYAGALAVDPTDPNVVYVGGSTQWATNPNLAHALVRIDTGDMRDANYRDPNTLLIPNDGDDIQKAAKAEAQGGLYAVGDPYAGEGVYWYDLVQRAAGQTGTGTSLPPEIHALAVDPQGRILVGTEGGLWRSVPKGYGYDFSSGGRGIFGGTDFNGVADTLTDLNGNLQISDLTSTAIDPATRGGLDTTEFGTGGAGSTGSLQWVSQGLTGPALGGVAKLGIPTAAVVVAAAPTPGTPAGTPTTLYRVWQYADTQAAQVEVSSDGGQTWAPVGTSGLPISSTSDPTAMFPALAINPNKVVQSGLSEDELLFGTSLVFLSDTSGSVWDAVPASRDSNPNSPVPLSSTADPISTIALAPSVSGVYYAGTISGKIFVTFNRGADNWTERDTGLPSGKVNGITVDPSNDLTAYALFGTSNGNAVWRTQDGGQTWTNISATLPNVPAYALVIDPRTTGGAVNGHLYVATDVGVYVSTDNAASWQRLGQGLPNVPVVGLQFNQNLETIAATTQGRGVFTISTDLVGPHVAGIRSTPGVASVQLTFNESLNVQTLTPAAITLTGPGGAVIPVTSITNVDTKNDDVFQINFNAASTPGSYTLTLQPTVTDLTGNPMDQNQNGVNGEVPGDIYTGRFLYQTTANRAPVLTPATASFGTINENAFTNAGLDVATLAAGLITDADAGAVPGIAVDGVVNTNGAWQFSTDGGTTWTNFGNPSPSNARLLQADAQNRIRFVPAFDYIGTATFTFRAWDLTSGLNPVNGSDGGVAPDAPSGGSTAYSVIQDSAIVNVQYVNQVPTFTAGPNETALENSGPQTVANWATGMYPGQPADAAQTLNFLVSSDNPGLFAAQPAVSATGTLTYTPAPNANGVAVVTVQLHDNGGTANGGQDTSAPQTFTITITPVNQAPSFTAGPNELVGRDAGSVTIPNWATNISAGPANESGQAVVFIVSNNNPGLFAVAPTVTPNGTLIFTPSSVTGVAVVTVQLQDNGGTANGGQNLSAPQQFTITVSGTTFHGTPNEVWVSQAYLDLLGRPVDPAALTFWTDQLESDVSRTTVAEELLNSTEYRTKLIQQTYQTLLGRAATGADVNSYLNFFLKGGTIEGMKALFFSSAEYLAHRGITSTPAWINAVYLDVLGHNADASAQSYWGTYYQAHTPLQTALGILTSSEADGDMVRHLYESLLGRDPLPSEGVISWYVDLQNGVRDETVTAGIAASDAYFTRWMPNFNETQMQNWISGVYKDVLGRPIDVGGLGIWMNALNHGLPRQDIVRQIVNSPEYQAREINQAYQTILNRPADPTGLGIAQQTLAQGGTLEQVKAVLFGSAEFYFGPGGGSASGFLDALYEDALGRPIDANGLSYWGTLLASEDRATLSLQLLGSTDGEKALVQNYYTAVLRRSADPAGQAYWAGQIASGVPDAYVLAGLAATREYYNRFPNS